MRHCYTPLEDPPGKWKNFEHVNKNENSQVKDENQKEKTNHSAAKTPADDTDQVMVALNLKEMVLVTISSYHHGS